jgi:hypothetical protein
MTSTRICQRAGEPKAELVNVPKPFVASAAQIGQVFGVAVDDAPQPNIYVAASSAYGLPIVVNGPDGQPLHVRKGAAGAAFMSGLWGAGGGPGSIWKIDGVTGAVSLLANVMLDGRPNSGAALGGLAYDAASKTLFVADRETGMIHSFGLDGAERGRFDHGVSGRTAKNLPPVPFDPVRRLDITSAAFDSGDPSTWGYAPPERRVYGLGILGRRLYYAVAEGLQIWSVGIGPDGAFLNDPAIEIAVRPAAGPTEISKIAFDNDNRMYLGERPTPTGAFDFEALTTEGIGRVLRYSFAMKLQSPAGSAWNQQPDEFSIGFPLQYRNGNGGVALGFKYDKLGRLELESCRRMLWATGEQLRRAADPALAKQLAETGAPNVDGLQAMPLFATRRHDEPPLTTYFIDYDDRFDDEVSRGHMGDIAIPDDCRPAQGQNAAPGGGSLQGGVRGGGGATGDGGGKPGGSVPPGGSNPPGGNPPGGPPAGGNPPGGGGGSRCLPPNLQIGPKCCTPSDMAPGGACSGSSTGSTIGVQCGLPNIQINGKCCSPADIAAGGACASCPANQTPVGPSHACCDKSRTYTDGSGALVCCSGPLVNGRCQPSGPPTGGPPCGTPPCCPSGFVQTAARTCCLASQMTSTGQCCPTGKVPSGPKKDICVRPDKAPLPPGVCCQAGMIPTENANCCDPHNVTSRGICCPPGSRPGGVNNDQCLLPIPIFRCSPGYTLLPGGICCAKAAVSEDGKSCNPPPKPRVECPDAARRTPGGGCCPSGTHWDAEGQRCALPPRPTCWDGRPVPSSGRCSCPPGTFPNSEGVCAPVVGPVERCPDGSPKPRNGQCPCPPGLKHDAEGRCVPPVERCPDGSPKPRNGQCPCPPGLTRNSEGKCVRRIICLPGSRLVGDRCVKDQIETCPPGKHRGRNGLCISDWQQPACRPGWRHSSVGVCVPDRQGRPDGHPGTRDNIIR